MPLELRDNSKWWYGRFQVNNRRFCVPLNVEVRGKIPSSLKQEGDVAFERSRAKAQAELEQLVAEARSKAVAERHLEKLYEIKTGESVGSVSLDKMAEAWDNLPNKRNRSSRYIELAHSVIDHFVKFLANNYSSAKNMTDVMPKMARAFLDAEQAKGVSGRTWNSKLILLRSAFRRLSREAGIASNPFGGIPTREEETVHRVPFSQEELQGILNSADDFIRPIIVTGICTAMRLGDCCLLKCDDVDMKQGFIVVKSSKTGETAEIPLFPMLRAEIEKQPCEGKYVFADQAKMFQTNRYGITKRTHQAMEDAGIQTQAERQNGTKKASVKDFHSLRTTWITLALSAGVPMELVRRVTGHATVDVVLKHYFRPGREDFRKALQTAMPKVITSSQNQLPPATHKKQVSLGKIREIMEGLNEKNWEKVRADVLAMLPATDADFSKSLISY